MLTESRQIILKVTPTPDAAVKTDGPPTPGSPDARKEAWVCYGASENRPWLGALSAEEAGAWFSARVCRITASIGRNLIHRPRNGPQVGRGGSARAHGDFDRLVEEGLIHC